jgi:alpha-1,2-mannosyltransferase
MESPRPRPRLRLTPRELRGQLIVLAVALWTTAAVNTTVAGPRLRSGQIKGTDFVHFYTLARLAAEGAAAHFADSAYLRQAQLRMIPESAPEVYPPVYGPQVALLLSPLGHLSYRSALITWCAFTTLVYFGLLSVVIRTSPGLRDYFGLALLGAAAFPPFWYLLQHGQLSVLGLAAFVGSWWFLRSGNEVAAGAMLGLLAYKPPLLAPVLAVLLLARSWRMGAAAAAAAAAEILSCGLWVHTTGLRDYADLLLRLPKIAEVMAAKPELMHSLRAFWSLLFPRSSVAVVLYGITAIGVIGVAALLWRRFADLPSLRMAVLLLATVLAAPHLYVYDLVILAPAWIWLVDWFLREPIPASVGRTLYLGYLAPLFGSVTRIVPVQLSVLCASYLLWALWRYRKERCELGVST